MVEPRGDTLIQSYATNTWLINHIVEGLTHEESLLQVPFPANCLNWVLGHIIAGRNTALGLLDVEPVWGGEAQARYRPGSDPIREGAAVRTLEELLRDLDASQMSIEQALGAHTDEQLEREAETDRGLKPIWKHLWGLNWHETFHIGQVEMLRDYALSLRRSDV